MTVHAGMAKSNAGIEIGVDKNTVSRFEQAAVLPPMARLIQLADVFEMPLEDLIRGTSSSVADTATEIARMLAKLDDDGRQFVRHIIEELCERLAPKPARR